MLITRIQYALSIYLAQLNVFSLAKDAHSIFDLRNIIISTLQLATVESFERGSLVLQDLLENLDTFVLPGLERLMWVPNRIAMQKHMIALDDFITILFDTNRIQDKNSFNEFFHSASKYACLMAEGIAILMPDTVIALSENMAKAFVMIRRIHKKLVHMQHRKPIFVGATRLDTMIQEHSERIWHRESCWKRVEAISDCWSKFFDHHAASLKELVCSFETLPLTSEKVREACNFSHENMRSIQFNIWQPYVLDACARDDVESIRVLTEHFSLHLVTEPASMLQFAAELKATNVMQYLENLGHNMPVNE